MEQLEMAFRLSQELTQMQQETGQTLTQLLDQKTTVSVCEPEDHVSTAPVPAVTKELVSPCQVTAIGATSNYGESLCTKELAKFYETSIQQFRKQKREANFIRFCSQEEERIYAKYQD